MHIEENDGGTGDGGGRPTQAELLGAWSRVSTAADTQVLGVVAAGARALLPERVDINA